MSLPWLTNGNATPPADKPAAAAPSPKAAPVVAPAHPTTAGHPLTIVRLTAENVKRLRAVSITPDGNLVVLSGRNGQGKTSVLDAIEYALGGKPDVAEPVRRGQDSAEVVCDLGDLIVRRRFVAGGSTTLEVTTREGLRYPSPQKILDELVGRLTFDPLQFARQEPKKQRETLQRLVGLDFSADEKRADLVFNERTVVNREVKAATARIAAMPEHSGVPAEPVSASDIAAEMQRAQQVNSQNADNRRALAQAEQEVVTRRQHVENLRAALAKAEESLRSGDEAVANLRERVAGARDLDLAPLTQRLATIDQTNQKVRANQLRRDIAAELASKQGKADELTAELDAIAKRQVAAIEAARMPVPGLGLGQVGVTLNGLPLEQASAAEQLRVSVAIALAMNPRLRVLLIRDASLLDHDSLRLVAEMAQAAGAQVWCERVETDEATSVVIEDGQVQGATHG